MTKKETVLAICAHNDDAIIGCGGTLVKYVKEGIQFKTIVFSYGESSHPHLKPEIITKTRVEEALKSDKIMGGSGIDFLGCKEGHFKEDIQKKNMEAKVMGLIAKYSPTKIFTHSVDDPHPDHRAIHNFVKDLVQRGKISADVYSFDVWNIWSMKKSDTPKLVVDTSKTFSKKIEAFKVHESQSMVFWQLGLKCYIKDRLNGIKNKSTFAEVFYKIQ